MENPPNTLPWKRFWVPVGGIITCDVAGGFLQDPDGTFGKFSNKDLRSLPELASVRCLILTGEPGIGKSQSLHDFISLPNPSHVPLLFVDFREFPDLDTFKEKVIKSKDWVNLSGGGATLRLLIDGLDEGLIKIPGFLEYFVSECRALPPQAIQNLRLILTCRILDWPWAVGQNLINLFSSAKDAEGKSLPNVWELCPLRRQDAMEAAVAKGLDSEGFIRTIYDQHLTALAARPITLFMLVRQFALKGPFSMGHRELYQAHSLALCEDYDKSRARRLGPLISGQVPSPQKLLRVSCKIAAYLMLCGKSSIVLKDDETPQTSDLLPSDVYGFDRLNDEIFEIDRKLVEATLSTALFWSKGIGRVGFQHQTFAESLAASYLEGLPLTEIRMLLCQRTANSEYVVPQLSEVASWLAASHPDFFAFVLEREPGILLRSDISLLGSSQKLRLVVAFLEAAQRLEEFDVFGRRLFFCSLNHPQLAETLAPFILDSRRNIVCRRAALTIGEECSTKELVRPLLQILKRKHDPLKRDIYSALEKMADSGTAPLLLSFLKRNHTHLLPRDRNYLISALLKTVWTLTDAIPFLNGQGKGYDSLHHSLPRYLKAEQNKEVLRKLVAFDHVLDSLHPLHQLADASCTMALDQLDDPEIASLLVEILRLSIRNGTLRSGGDEAVLKTRLEKDSITRRKLIGTMVETQGDENPLLSNLPGNIAKEEDYPWMLQSLMEAHDEKRKPWLAMVQVFSVWRGSAWDQFLETLARVPELALSFGWRESTPLQKRRYFDPIEKQARQDKARWLRWRARRPKIKEPEPREEWLKADFESLEKGFYRRWVDLTQNLFREEDGHYRSTSSHHDLTEAPGWSKLTAEQKTKVIDAARTFLLKWKGSANEKPNRGTNYSEAAYYAIYMLRDVIASERSLAKAVGSNWIPAVFNFIGNDAAHHSAITKLIYRLNAPACRHFFVGKLRANGRADRGLTMAIRPLRETWDKPLLCSVIAYLKKDTYQPQTASCIIQDLAEINYSDAVTAWQMIVQRFSKTRGLGADFIASATATLMADGIAKSWEKTFPLLKRKPGLAADVFYQLATHEHDFGRLGLRELAPRHLGSLFLLLYKLFPPSKDDPIPEGGHSPTAKMHVARMREETLNAISSFGDEAACKELLHLASRTSPEDAIWIRARFVQALQEWRKKSWLPHEPRLLNQTLRSRPANLIQNEDDLLLVIVDSLGRLQEDLQHRSNSNVLNYWLWNQKGNKKTNFCPKGEVEISALIADWLRKDLGQGGPLILVEVQIQWNRRSDIEVVAAKTRGGVTRHLALTLEIKKSSNREVQHACQSQLVNTYLKRSGKKHGIYLVAHLTGGKDSKPRTYLKSRSVASMRAEVSNLADTCMKTDASLALRGFLLHLSL